MSTTSFTTRSAIGLSNGNQTFYLNIQGNLIVASGISNAAIFIITQVESSTNTPLYHNIRYGGSYVAPGPNNTVIIQNQPYNWLFITNLSVPPTTSTIDLLNITSQFTICNSGGQGVYITTSGILGLISLAPISSLNNQVVLITITSTQPVIDQVRNISGVITSGDYPSYSSVFTTATSLTIYGFKAGSAGQNLLIYATASAVLTIENLSSQVSAADQIMTAGGGTEISPANGSFQFIYDGTLQKWVMLTQQSASGGTTITLANGSAAAPSLSFIDDLNTGLFHSGVANDHVLRFAASGMEIVDISPSGLIPAADNTFSLGASGLAYARVETYNVVSASGLTLLTPTTLTLNALSGVLPASNNTISLGLSGTQWSNVGTYEVSSGNANLILQTASGVVPTADNVFSLGISGTRWATVYAEGINSGSGNITMTPNTAVLPAADLSYNLGSSGERWAQVLTGQVNSGAGTLVLASLSGVVPVATFQDFGASGNPWNFVYSTNVSTSNIYNHLNPNITVHMPGSDGFIPSTDNVLNIGLSGSAWQNVFTYGISTNGNANLTISPSGSNVVPAVDNTMSLGVSGDRWSNLYATNMYAGNFTQNAVFENGTLSGVLTTTGTAITGGTPSFNGSWYRVNNIITAGGLVAWSGLTAGTGNLIITRGVPSQYRPSISGIPGTLTFQGLSGLSGQVQIIADMSVSGQVDLVMTTTTGVQSAVPAAGMIATGSLTYSFNYSTIMLS